MGFIASLPNVLSCLQPTSIRRTREQYIESYDTIAEVMTTHICCFSWLIPLFANDHATQTFYPSRILTHFIVHNSYLYYPPINTLLSATSILHSLTLQTYKASNKPLNFVSLTTVNRQGLQYLNVISCLLCCFEQ